MKTLLKTLALAGLLALQAFGQTALTATTLSSAVSSSSTQTVVVVSGTGITAGSTAIYVDMEYMPVISVTPPGTTGVTTLTVRRGASGTRAFPHISGAMVLAAPPPAFIAYDPSGACTNGQGLFLYSPVLNINNGKQWLCSTITGKIIPGFGNNASPAGVSTAVASAAGLITPSGPLFHITGTAAITGFNIPVGFDPKGSGPICVLPDGAFTTTNANNIAIASTGVTSKTLCWTYDANTAKFYPSY